MPRPDILSRRIREFLRFLNDERGAAPMTQTSYESDLRHCAAWLRASGELAAGQSWDKVTHLQLKRYIGECGQRYAVASVARRVTALKTFFAWLEKQGLRDNPAVALPSPKIAPKSPAVLSLADIEKLLAVPDVLSAAGKRDRALLEVLYSTGMRVGECAALTLNDVHWRDGEVCVRQKRGARLVMLGRPALEALRGYVQNGRPELVRRRAGIPPGELWITRSGTPMKTPGIEVVLRTCSKHAQLGYRVTPMMLRQACTAHLLQNGADVEAVSELLGYQNTQAVTRLSREL